MSEGKVHMPHFYKPDSVSHKLVNEKQITDTLFHSVGDIELMNQLGKTVSLNKDLAGRFVVIDFFFINCPTICPRLSSNMRLLQAAFKKNPRKESQVDTLMQLVSITVNPAHDTVSALRQYADKYGANHDHWWFLTGNKALIYAYARNELGVVADQGDGGPNDFIHTDKIVLLDRERHIRGYYNGLDSLDVKRCADDIILLTLEKNDKPKK